MAIPYQAAKRKLEEVQSYSSSLFESILGHGFKKTCDYHSHTCVPKREKPVPSETDIEELFVNEMEFIVQIRRCRTKKYEIRLNPGGTIGMSWGRYRGLIAAFSRCRNPHRDKNLYYKQVRLALG